MGTCRNLEMLYRLMLIVNTYINKQDVSDKNSPLKLRDAEHFDFIIVGGGSAGCQRFLIGTCYFLEAGGEEPLEADVPAFRDYIYNTRLDWQYKTQPQPGVCGGKPCSWPRGKCLGGTSVMNSMIYNRGNKRDYNHWEELGNKGWCYKDVLPYFMKSENNQDESFIKDRKYHSVGGYLDVGRFPYQDENVHSMVSAFEELGYKQVDFNADHVTGVMVAQCTQYNGERRSVNRAYLEPVRYVRPNLKIVTNVRVTKILIHSENDRAYGVEYAYELDRSVIGKVFAKKEVIVSGGAVNTPQLLMLSGIGPEKDLNDLGIKVIKNLNVGYNLQDHVTANGFTFTMVKSGSTVPTNEQIEEDFKKYTQSKRNGPLSGTGLNQLEGYIKSRFIPKSEDYPDIQYFMYTNIVSDDPNRCSVNITRPLSYYNTLHYLPALVRPSSRGRITINSTNPFDTPLIYPNYFHTRRDLDIFIDAMNVGIKLADTNALKQAGFVLDRTPLQDCKDYPFGSDAYWICIAKNYTMGIYHPSGTCPMGPKSNFAVVDPTLKVHGIKNLRVADASIMPRVASGNLNAIIIMIAEKCSDLIKEDWHETTKQKRLRDLRAPILAHELNQHMKSIANEIEK